MTKHEIVLQRAIDLAKLGAGYVSPNPMVGAVITHQGEIIGEGYHQKYGEAHAEVNAVADVFLKHENAAELLKEATLYVTLEPCAHFGKTPPCSDLIIQHQIPEVVIGCTDPFSKVNGKGIEKLQNAGIKVTTGILEQECLALNKRFFTRVEKQRPFIILKWAQTINGYFATKDGSRKWISGKEAKMLVHQWRSEEDCVLVGKRTAEIDNPELNVRLVNGKNPKRAVIDRDLKLDKKLHLFDNTIETFVFNKELTAINGQVKYIGIEDFEYFLPQYLLYQLYLQDIQSVIIEGGIKTLQMFIAAGLWDEARIFISPIAWEDGLKAPEINGIQENLTDIGRDKLLTLTPQHP